MKNRQTFRSGRLSFDLPAAMRRKGKVFESQRVYSDTEEIGLFSVEWSDPESMQILWPALSREVWSRPNRRQLNQYRTIRYGRSDVQNEAFEYLTVTEDWTSGEIKSVSYRYSFPADGKWITVDFSGWGDPERFASLCSEVIATIRVRPNGEEAVDGEVSTRKRRQKATPVVLPGRLAHLEAVVTSLSAYEPDELNEDHQEAFDLVEARLNERTRGMSRADRRRLIESDVAELRAVLDAGSGPPQVAFLVGALEGLLMFGDGRDRGEA